MHEVSLNVFLKTLRESCQNERRYCFVLGAGASRESGISTGEEMAKLWSREINDNYSEKDREAIMGELGIEDITPSSENYFDLYALRFYPDYHNGSAYLARAMEQAQPSFGYYPLATHLAGTENNLVITTNFDSLVEDALFIYTDKRPLVISHELLADYININMKRPIVAKLHRGLFFDPLNRKEEVTGLSEKWKSVLRTAFQVFTPVFIGYAGGDHSLMDFLKEDSVRMNGLYWCYRHEAPSEEIQRLVESKGGYFVPIEGFDEMMYLLGREFGYKNPRARILKTANQRVKDYDQQQKLFHEKLDSLSTPTLEQSQIIKSLTTGQAEDIAYWSKQIERNPSDAYAYQSRADVYLLAKDYGHALEDLSRAISIFPESGEFYNSRGDAYYFSKRYEEAVADYTAAIELDPEEYLYVYNRALAYSELDRYQKAVSDFTRVLELTPGQIDAYLGRTKAYRQLKQYGLAFEDLEHALTLAPDNHQLYNSLGYLYDATGDHVSAVLYYTKAIDFKPDYATAYNNRAAAYIDLRDYDAAFLDIDTALTLNPAYPNPRYHKGRALALQGRPREAVKELTEAIRLRPDYIEAYRERAEAYAAIRQTRKAAADREKADELEQAEAPAPAAAL